METDLITLAYWQVGTLIAVFIMGLRSLYKQGFSEGRDKGINTTLAVLEKKGIIQVDENENIVGWEID